jgi:hypothetical protein
MRWTPHPRVTYTELAGLLREALEIGNAHASGRKNGAEKWRDFAARTQRRIAL